MCTAADEKNVVDFGNIEAKFVGVACVWSRSDGSGVQDAYDSDVRFNKTDGYAWHTGECSGGTWSVQAVGAHEFGHIFGLHRVGEAKHGNLTMSKKLNGPCQESEYTLGKGDVLGLRVRY